MSEKFLKARIPAALYNELQVQAAEAGKRLGTHVRDVLQQHAETLTVAAAIARIEAAIGDKATATKAPAADHEMRPLLDEIRLLVRELAMQANAQIITRVVAQLAVQAKAEALQ
jgi:hypothetical protein